MFNSGKTVLYMTGGKVFCRSFLGKKIENFSFDWDQNSLSDVFKKIKLKIKNSQVKVILGNDLSYVMILTLLKEETSLERVAQELKKFILGEVSKNNFRYEIKGQDVAGKNIIQVFAVSHDLLTAISKAAKVAEVRIDFFVPIALALSEALDSPKKTLLLWEGEEKVAIITNNQTVFISESITSQPKALADEIMTVVKDNFSFEPEIFFSNLTQDVVLDLLPTNSVKIDPILTVNKRKKEGIYLEAINPIIKSENKVIPIKPIEEKKVQTSLTPAKIIVIVLIALIFVYIIFYGLMAKKNNDLLIEKNNTQIESVTPNIITRPTTSQSPAQKEIINQQNTEKVNDINTIENGVISPVVTPAVSPSVTPSSNP